MSFGGVFQIYTMTYSSFHFSVLKFEIHTNLKLLILFAHTIILTMEKSGSSGKNDSQMCFSGCPLTNRMPDANSRCRPGDIVGGQGGEATGSVLMMAAAFQDPSGLTY